MSQTLFWLPAVYPLEILNTTGLDKVFRGLIPGIRNIPGLEAETEIKGNLEIEIQKTNTEGNKVTGDILQMGIGKNHMTNMIIGGVPVIIGAIQIMIGGVLANLKDTPEMIKGTKNMTGGALVIKNRTLGGALQEEINMRTELGLAAN